MKRLFIAIATLFLGITLIGCQPKEFTVHMFFYDNADPYITSIRNKVKANLEAKQIKYEFYDGANDQAKQNIQIETAITKNADMIVVNMVNAETLETIYKKTSKAKIPLVSFNRQPGEKGFLKDKKDVALLDAESGSDGRLRAKQVFDFVSQDYDKYLKTDGKTLKYIYVHGDRSMQVAIEGGIAFKAELKRLLNEAGKNDPEFAVGVETDLDSNWQAAQAKTLMDTLFTKPNFDINKVDVISACNDDSALGILQSLQIKGYNLGYDKDGNLPKNTIPLFGLDALQPGRTAIKEGKMTGSVLQDAAENARLIVAATENIKEKKDYILDKTADKVKIDDSNGYVRVLIEFKIYDPKVHGETLE